MNIWHLLLYAFASLLALRSLASLMTQHRRESERQLIREEIRRREAASTVPTGAGASEKSMEAAA